MMPRPALDAHLTLLGWEPTLSDHGVMGFMWALFRAEDQKACFSWDHRTLPGFSYWHQWPSAAKRIEWSAMSDKHLAIMADEILHMKDTL